MDSELFVIGGKERVEWICEWLFHVCVKKNE